MNYVTDGTFWVVTIFLTAGLWAVWYRLKKENDKTAKDLKELRKTLSDGLATISESVAEDANNINIGFKDLLFLIGTAYGQLGIITENTTSKKTKDKLDTFYADREEKIENIIKRYGGDQKAR